MKTCSSKNYKMVTVNSEMTTAEFIGKVAKIFNVRKELICITYQLKCNADDEVITIEIEERDPGSLLNAINVLKDFSKLTVEVKLQPNPSHLPIMDGKCVVCQKEVITEQIKREMGFMMTVANISRGFGMVSGLKIVPT